MARHPRLKVMALETRLGTRYTAETLARLGRWPGHRFVWLMGADNLAPAAALVEMARHPRRLPGCGVRAPSLFLCGIGRSGGAGVRGSGGCRRTRADELPLHPPPAWVFVRIRPHPASATAIRADRRRGGG